MKKSIAIITVFCAVIIGLSIFKNISFNNKILTIKTTELLKDSLLLKQTEIQDLMLQKNAVLDSMRLDKKTSDSIIQEEIQKIKDNSNKILIFQKKIFQNRKE